MGTATFDFSDDVVIVTGGSSGIGRATALEFAEAGATVVVADVRHDPKDLDAETPTDATPPSTESSTGTPTETDTPGSDPGSSDLLWRLGEASGTPADFGDRADAAETITVPGDWSDRDDWSAVPRGLDRVSAPALELEYDLDTVPEGGATFAARITNASACAVPRMAVFSNGVMVGNVQIAGLDGIEVTEEVDFRTTTTADASAPLWVRIDREGDRITGSYSTDGESWTELESLEMDMSSDAYVGIAACAPGGGEGTVALDGLDGEGVATWESRGIGAVDGDGSVSYADGSATVTAPVGDIDGEDDAFRYLFRELDGDGTLVVRVASLGEDGPPAKAGVMIREALDADSPTAATVLDAAGEVAFTWRPVLPDLPEMRYTDTYEVYVPPEFLEAGTNTLELRATRGLYTGEAVDDDLYWDWETLALFPLAEPPDEPIHGRYVRMGTMFDSGGTTGAGRDPSAVIDYLAPLIEWLGIAYSANTLRMGEFGFPRAYLETVRDLNTSVCTLHFQNYTGPDPDELEDGELAPATKEYVETFLAEKGEFVEYYEVGNEPSIFGGNKRVAVELAKYVQEIKDEHAPHLKVVAPGWFYTGYDDHPTGWAADPDQRREVERHCDLTNGHAYGHEYCNGRGANLVENVMTFGGTGDRGLPKPTMTTEMGTNDWHTDHDAFDSAQPHASIFDRICRAHLGFADQFMQHAAFFRDGFALFEAPETFTGPDAPPPEDIAVYPGVDGEDPRVKTYRRLALAYATHGSPLPYTHNNRDTIAGRKVYVRAVDTRTLDDPPTSPGSEKLLVNLVNFESDPVTIDVTVTMPAATTYEGDRYGEVTNGTTYGDAHTAVTVDADPEIDLRETLGPGGAVQYIFE